METDREVLLWFHQRLINVHRESANYDYIRRLRWIIQSTNSKKTSRGFRKVNCNNSLSDISKIMKNLSAIEKDMIKES